MGCTEIFGVERSEHRARMARDNYGLDAVYSEAASVSVANRIMEATGGRGVDVCFEVAGGPDTADVASRCCKRGGELVVIGICTDDHCNLTHTICRRAGLTVKWCRRMRRK